MFRYLDIEQSLSPSNTATFASVCKLTLPECDRLDNGRPTLFRMFSSRSAEDYQTMDYIMTLLPLNFYFKLNI